MKAVRKAILVVVLSIVLPPGAYAVPLPGDAASGKRLYEAHCTECHDTSVLTRQDRFVQSLEALQEQLLSCAHMAGKQLSETEAQDLLKYLNDEFYHFD